MPALKLKNLLRIHPGASSPLWHFEKRSEEKSLNLLIVIDLTNRNKISLGDRNNRGFVTFLQPTNADGIPKT